MINGFLASWMVEHLNKCCKFPQNFQDGKLCRQNDVDVSNVMTIPFSMAQKKE